MNTPRLRVHDFSTEETKSLLALGLRGAPGTGGDRRVLEMLHRVLSDPKSRKTLLRDLKSPVLDPAAGLLAFDRLIAIKAEDRESLAEKTYLTAVHSAATTRGALEALARWGRLLERPLFPQSTRAAGLAIRALALAALATHHGVRLDRKPWVAEALGAMCGPAGLL